MTPTSRSWSFSVSGSLSPSASRTSSGTTARTGPDNVLRLAEEEDRTCVSGGVSRVTHCTRRVVCGAAWGGPAAARLVWTGMRPLRRMPLNIHQHRIAASRHRTPAPSASRLRPHGWVRGVTTDVWLFRRHSHVILPTESCTPTMSFPLSKTSTRSSGISLSLSLSATETLSPSASPLDTAAFTGADNVLHFAEEEGSGHVAGHAAHATCCAVL